MSRHRFIRNLDLDEEMQDSASDSGNEWDDMDADQAAQMDSGLAHVRSLLGSAADSGISDKEVKDSLWYYFFDAEQTVEWLLAERDKNAKKGKKNERIRPPPQPRPSPASSSATPPLTALQRLSLSRKALPSSPASGRLAALAARNSPSPSPTSSTTDAASSSPKLSKLAMLAKTRSAAASAASSVVPSPAPSPPVSPAPSDKPLSKLQAKMLAARQATAAASSAPSITIGQVIRSPESAGASSRDLADDPMVAAAAAASEALFGAPSSPSLHANQPSAFASLLVTSRPSEGPKNAQAPTLFTTTDIFVGASSVEETMEDLRRAFKTLSPDDVVAEKRKGTAVGARLAEGPAVGGAKGRN